jgi:2'-5' RNA ligase
MPQNMIALFVAPSDREKLLALIPKALQKYAQPADSLHLTLTTWESSADLTEDDIKSIITRTVDPQNNYMPLSGMVSGFGVFEPEEADKPRVLYASFDYPYLTNLREHIRDTVIWGDSEHGFTPHITLAYLPVGTKVPDLQVAPFKLTFDRLYLASDEEIFSNGVVAGVQELPPGLTTPFELAKSIRELESGDLEIVVKGVPFGGPAYLGGKDIDQEYFSKSTNIYPLPVVHTYFHHTDDPVYGKSHLGYAYHMSSDELATLGLDPEEGHFYRVIVDKATKYKKALRLLAENKFLGASSTPYQKGVVKGQDGHWDTWPVVEMTLTYAMSNPEAETIFAKAFQGDIEMAVKKLAVADTAAQPLEVPAVPEVPEVVVANPDTLAADIQKAVDDAVAEEPVTDEAAAAAQKSVTIDELTAVEARIDAKLVLLQKSVDALVIGMPTLAATLAKSFKGADIQKSAAELAAEQNLRQSVATRRVDTGLPAGAPGNN